MEINSYAVLADIGNPEKGLGMIINSTEELSEKEVIDIAISKIHFDVRKIVKGNSYEFKKVTDNGSK